MGSTSASLPEICSIMGEIAAEAADFSNASFDRIARFKRETQAAVFSELEDGKKTKASFLSTSLIAVDVDQKGRGEGDIIHPRAVLQRFSEAGIAALLYTTFSHRPEEPCFRLLIDLGKDCGWDDHRRSCIWLQNNLLADLCELGVVDRVSWSPIQPMVLPYGYRYQKPVVELIEGQGLWEAFYNELSQIRVTCHEKTNKVQKIEIGNRNLRGEPEKLLVDQVSYLHRKLKYYKHTAGSIQFWRSNADSNPGLYCKQDWRAVYDPAKSRRYSLIYSVEDYREALDHRPVDRRVRELSIREWIDSAVAYALFTENCGTGKSEVLLSLSADSPARRRYIFTFSTLANRDAFACRAKNAVVIKSTSEIIREVVSEDQAKSVLAFVQNYFEKFEAIRKRRNALIESNGGATNFLDSFLDKEEDKAEGNGKPSMMVALQKCVGKELISSEECKLINDEIRNSQKNLAKERHLLMTTRKLEYLVGYGEEGCFEDDVVFTDEHQIGMLTNCDENQRFEVYGDVWSPEKTDGIDRLKLHRLKRCIVTSEDSAAHELRYNNIQFVEVGGVNRTPDFRTFEILLVPSTSSQQKGGEKSNRELIKDAVERVSANTVIIGDKLNGVYNLVNCRGVNDLRESDTVVLLSMPSAMEIVKTQACTGLDRRAATSLIMSDKANQAIGRNQGYRNRDEHGNPSSGGNHCLLIIPNRDDFDIELRNVTTKVVNARHWMAANGGLKISPEQKKDFYFQHVIDQIVSSIKKSDKK